MAKAPTPTGVTLDQPVTVGTAEEMRVRVSLYPVTFCCLYYFCFHSCHVVLELCVLVDT